MPWWGCLNWYLDRPLGGPGQGAGDPRGKWEPGWGQTLELSQVGTMGL